MGEREGRCMAQGLQKVSDHFDRIASFTDLFSHLAFM
jgi:hypothetical protein